ncbi:MAG: hypothetical protein KI792_10780 [Alphaproteobacteria bacterium]|nr:hypothetical protein [Alphaproteobacteria bacterium SS10]
MANRNVIPQPLSEEMPPFDPTIWARPDVDKTTNCFAFAADDPEGHVDTYGPQPGDRQFNYLREISVKEITKKAATDNFTPIGNDPKQKAGHYLVFLAVSPGNDYHWYRQMADGTWWHKPAPGKALTNKDYDGNVITDPRTANRRNKRYHYNKSGGFFQVPYGGVRVGITPDRRWLKEFELQEVLDLVECQRQRRTEEAKTDSKRKNREFKEKRAEIKGGEPRNAAHRWLRKAWHAVEDQIDKLRGRPLRERLSAEGQLEAYQEEVASQSRQADRTRRRNEIRELKRLIDLQEHRAIAGFRPDEEMVKYKISRQKGQRHSFVVATDAALGNITWASITIEGQTLDAKAVRDTTALGSSLLGSPGLTGDHTPNIDGCFNDLVGRVFQPFDNSMARIGDVSAGVEKAALEVVHGGDQPSAPHRRRPNR